MTPLELIQFLKVPSIWYDDLNVIMCSPLVTANMNIMAFDQSSLNWMSLFLLNGSSGGCYDRCGGRNKSKHFGSQIGSVSLRDQEKKSSGSWSNQFHLKLISESRLENFIVHGEWPKESQRAQ